MQYLSTHLGRPVQFDSVKQSGMLSRAKDADIVLVNPLLAVKILDHYAFEAIATQSHKQLGPKFAGVIITYRDSSITSLTHLAGKRVGVVHMKNAAGGFLFQAKELLNAGLVPERDFTNFEIIQNQNAIVQHVINKRLDAGEMCVVPKGTEHRPVCKTEVTAMLIEIDGTLTAENTGGAYAP